MLRGLHSNIVAFVTLSMKQPFVFASCRDQGQHARINNRHMHSDEFQLRSRLRVSMDVVIIDVISISRSPCNGDGYRRDGFSVSTEHFHFSSHQPSREQMTTKIYGTSIYGPHTGACQRRAPSPVVTTTASNNEGARDRECIETTLEIMLVLQQSFFLTHTEWRLYRPGSAVLSRSLDSTRYDHNVLCLSWKTFCRARRERPYKLRNKTRKNST